jgi:hypothetical protein
MRCRVLSAVIDYIILHSKIHTGSGVCQRLSPERPSPFLERLAGAIVPSTHLQALLAPCTPLERHTYRS